MATTRDLSEARWRKSSHSDANGGQCVEVATNLPGAVVVRDSKDTSGAVLGFTALAWTAFIRSVRA